jgi:hypothetical protein
LEDDEERIEMSNRRAIQTDVPRIMEIRHSVRENRLGDPNLVTTTDCVAFIEDSEIWVWEEDGAVQGFAAGDIAMAGFSGCSWRPSTKAVVSVSRFYHWPARRFGKPGTPLRNWAPARARVPNGFTEQMAGL